MSERLVIDRLGAQGDGIAHSPRGQVYVPFALAGETVNVALEKDRATLIAVIEASPDRVEPACRHFGECGGCALQHLEQEAYRRWKRDKVAHLLSSRGMDAPVDELVACPPHSRRRAAFTARRTEAGMLLGYNRAQSNQIIDIEECPILLPEIVAALPRLRALAELVCMTKSSFRLTVTATDTGLDVAAEGSGRLEGAARRAAADHAARLGFDRLSVDGEIVIEPRKPQIAVGTASIVPPPGGFLQAVADTEQAMADLIRRHFGKAKRVADLFSGAGAFALRLAESAAVHAVEGDAAALAALDRGFRFGTGLRRVTSERRDLFRRPLTFKELNAFDAVVFDPPRAGAEDQARQIARSDVPAVCAVSCNPVTLARDLAVLLEGGYRLERVVPFDQFLWSPHVEAVALLSKPKKRR
ncbi:class I SAM-dependent RNA methyltransferase [Mesorhizobium xinjiangense]|uniref:class I SAM-dependent RNA methyltransferase n=1 Tax=Mesorhizobium xinjiangense TaxID=2678685 RepID=UPI0012ECC14E|nr:class I SAM-dependent RNA methyltransferase [Mesorhizobium xinjiangense]